MSDHGRKRRRSRVSLLLYAAWFTVIGLRAAGVIGWSWSWVLLPLWVSVTLAGLMAVTLLGLFGWARVRTWWLMRGTPPASRQLDREILRDKFYGP